jgi:hypothetical protein
MKRIALTLTIAASLFAFTGCTNEKAALETFKTETAALDTWAKAQNKGPEFTTQLTAKMKAIKTDGLPADLKEAWTSAVDGVEKMNAVAAEISKNPEAIGKMLALAGEMEPRAAKLKEVANKHGITTLDEFGGGGKKAPAPAQP